MFTEPVLNKELLHFSSLMNAKRELEDFLIRSKNVTCALRRRRNVHRGSEGVLAFP